VFDCIEVQPWREMPEDSGGREDEAVEYDVPMGESGGYDSEGLEEKIEWMMSNP
jgi:hypothetical protein